MLTNQIRKEWQSELRSGKYKQIYHKLYGDQENERCGLGILCGILRHHNIDLTTIPPFILSQVIKMNDVEKLTFEQIADRLELL